ncbi:MAG TPA: hypothetical protein VFW52_00245 [Candidatus Saccharimonadales bacterium]|nr:hypothetical protein [Candidatus Saccharimonadales bacterium]
MKLIANTMLICAAAVALMSLQWGKPGTMAALTISAIGLTLATSAAVFGRRRQA